MWGTAHHLRMGHAWLHGLSERWVRTSVAWYALIVEWWHWWYLAIERAHVLHARRILSAVMLLELPVHIRTRVARHVATLRRVKRLAMVRRRHGLNGHHVLWKLVRHLMWEWRLHRRRALACGLKTRECGLVCHVGVGFGGVPCGLGTVRLRYSSVEYELLLLLFCVVVRD